MRLSRYLQAEVESAEHALTDLIAEHGASGFAHCTPIFDAIEGRSTAEIIKLSKDAVTNVEVVGIEGKSPRHRMSALPRQHALGRNDVATPPLSSPLLVVHRFPQSATNATEITIGATCERWPLSSIAWFARWKIGRAVRSVLLIRLVYMFVALAIIVELGPHVTATLR